MEHLYWFQPNFTGSAKKSVVTCISICNRQCIDMISGVSRSVAFSDPTNNCFASVVKIDCQNGSKGSKGLTLSLTAFFSSHCGLPCEI